MLMVGVGAECRQRIVSEEILRNGALALALALHHYVSLHGNMDRFTPSQHQQYGNE